MRNDGDKGRDGIPLYQLWETVLQILALHVELDELEASVLGAILPNLAALRGRPVAVPPELDAQSMRLRLLRVLRTLVERAPWPVLLLLEDLQWADAESLGLLAQVSRDLDQDERPAAHPCPESTGGPLGPILFPCSLSGRGMTRELWRRD